MLQKNNSVIESLKKHVISMSYEKYFLTLEVNFVIIYLYEIEIISYLKVILTPHFYIQRSVQSYGRLRDYLWQYQITELITQTQP